MLDEIRERANLFFENEIQYISIRFIMFVGAVFSAGGFISDIGANFAEKALLSTVIFAIFLLIAIGRMSKKLSEIKGELEEQKVYNNMIDEKYTQPVAVNNKGIKVELAEQADDKVTYTHKICALENNTIETFYGLIGTNKQVAWEDLDIDIDGGKIEEHFRRDYEEFSRFIISIKLYSSVDSSESYELSYTIHHDVVDIQNDYSYLNIRHKTDETNFELVFPKEFNAKHATAKQDEPEDCEVTLHDPEIDDSKENNIITWRHNDLSLGDRYKLEWFSEKEKEKSE